MATLVIDEVPMLVTGVGLNEGAIVILACHQGAMRYKELGLQDVALHGDDGKLIVSGHIKTGWPEQYEEDRMDVAWKLWPQGRRLVGDRA